MSTEHESTFGSPADFRAAFRHELSNMRDHWWWFTILGAAFVVLGTIALGYSVAVSITTVILFGFLLVAAGAVQIVSAFWAQRWSGTLLHLFIGILYVITGFFMVDAPLESTVELTLIMAMFLIVGGMFRIVAALLQRFHDWPWVLLNGVVTLFLGLLIYKQWPASGLWVIGLFVGVDLIFNGWYWIALSLGLRNLKS